MVYIIGFLTLVFLVLTIMVIARLQNVLKGVKSDDKTDGTPPGNRLNANLFILFTILSILGVIFTYVSAKADFLPEASSIHGRRVDDLFWFSMGVLAIPFLIVNFLLFFFSYKYQYKPGRKATFYPENHRLEIIWTAIPAVVMALLVFTGWRAWSDITSDAPSDSEVIEIVGKQFNWIVRYGGVENNQLGNYNYKLIDAQNEIGIDLTDENSLDDFTNNTEIHIPVGRPVLLKIRARDVLHSVFIPHMRVKMDAVPGMPTRFWFVADKTTNEIRAELGDPDFDYELACTEICGRGHFAMRMRVIVEDEASYRKWVSEQKTFLQTYPAYLAKVPDNLKAKAMKYLPAEPTAAPADSTTAQAPDAAAAAPGASASLR
ncbi:cytochrome c oxidase subunit II [Telluribacter sp.]|jgi:cytochrome c oxidase subunit 2|uniref:cytochrome c oxidase subunit II n=1 Tax=Telluribacter sp. TaxID=1978767 RepID=UPI002E150423|nr:cytochrome c oxidase subunit II [Telluribacter sp.]